VKRRKPLLILSAVSALIGSIAIADWGRSYWFVDQLRYQGWWSDGNLGRAWLKTERGGIWAGYARFSADAYRSPPFSQVLNDQGGWTWTHWKAPLVDDNAAFLDRLGTGYSSSGVSDSYQMRSVHFPCWLVMMLAVILPARWCTVQRANRRRGFAIDPATTSPPPPTPPPAAATPIA
jgi:hypothetical protein